MKESRSRAAIAQLEATVVLIVVSVSLASVVYDGLKRGTSVNAQPVFVNQETLLGGTPPIERVSVYSSSTTLVSSLSLDAASSADGVLAFDGSSYFTSGSLCAAGVTTFFSIFVPQDGTLRVSTDGIAWVAGILGNTVTVSRGEHELMITAGTFCSVSLPGGQVVPQQWTPSSNLVTTIPTEGGLGGTSFLFYVPHGGGPHRLLLTARGGFDSVAL